MSRSYSVDGPSPGRRHPALRFLLVNAVLMIAGCDSGATSPFAVTKQNIDYDFEIMNRSGEAVDNCGLTWGTDHVSVGGIVANGTAAYGTLHSEIPETTTVTWTTKSDNQTHSVVCEVPKDPPAGEYLAYYVVIFPDHTVKLKLLSQDAESVGEVWKLGCNGGPEYFIKTKNASRTDLKQVQVYFGDYLVNGSEFEDIGAQTFWGNPSFGLPYPVTETARVLWTTPDGMNHKQVVELKENLPDDLNGVCIVFVIDQTNKVHLRFLPWNDWKNWQNKDLLN